MPTIEDLNFTNDYLVRITLQRRGGGFAVAQYDVRAPTAAAAIALGKRLAKKDYPRDQICEAFAEPKKPDPNSSECQGEGNGASCQP